MWFRNIFPAKSPRQNQTGGESNEGLLSPHALRQLDHLALNAARTLPGLQAGARPSRRQKPSFDFRDHRRYVPGDDARYIDWKASARQEHIFVRQGEQPKDAPVYLLIDCSKSMAWGEPPKFKSELQLAAGLGYLALAHGDRLSVLPFAGRLLPPFGPVSGKGQVPAMLNFIGGLSFHTRSDLRPVLKYLSTRAARGGLLLLLSDFLNLEGLEDLLDRFREPAWDVVLLQMLHPEEIQPTLRGNFELIDTETGRRSNYDLDAAALQQYAFHFEERRAALDRLCDEHNAFFTSLSTGGSLEHDLLPKLVSTRIVRVL